VRIKFNRDFAAALHGKNLYCVSQPRAPPSMHPLIYFLLAVLEFFVLNWMGKHSIASGYHRISFIQTVEDSPLFDVVFRVLAPTVFLVVTAAAWYALGFDAIVKHYWWVTVCYFAVRWSFNLVMGRAKLLNWGKQLLVASLAIALSVAVAEKLLVSRDAVLPSARALTDELWIVVIGFLYLTGTRVSWPTIGPSAEERKNAYIAERYRTFRKRFGHVIHQVSDGPLSEASSYAILIYESFNRPRIYQWIESAILFPAGVANTLGPMQVSTQVNLPAAELVRLGVERVNQALSEAATRAREEYPQFFPSYEQLATDAGDSRLGRDDVAGMCLEALPLYVQTDIVSRAAAKYNIRSDYPAEVAGIFESLRESFYPGLNSEKPSGDDALSSRGHR
jgi:hypothetical protein